MEPSIFFHEIRFVDEFLEQVGHKSIIPRYLELVISDRKTNPRPKTNRTLRFNKIRVSYFSLLLCVTFVRMRQVPLISFLTGRFREPQGFQT